MASAGYIYVLVNSSMLGLLKVGKTRRLPSERVQELSSATGVATPFIVAFEQYFDDCDMAEDFVHCELERRGSRQAQNREFFRATPNEVIRIIMQAPTIMHGNSSDSDIVLNSEFSTQDGRDGNQVSISIPQARLWSDLMDEADNFYFGRGEELRDHEEALKIYKVAARLGSPEACEQIGRIYWYGEGVPEDTHAALIWFKEGAKRGNWACYSTMATIFNREGDIENACKCYQKYFQGREKYCKEHNVDIGKYDYECEQYLHLCIDNNLQVQFHEQIAGARERILSRIIPRLGDQDLHHKEKLELLRVQRLLHSIPENSWFETIKSIMNKSNNVSN